MAFTKYKEVKYAAAGIPASGLTDFPKLLVVAADADVAAELSGGGGVKFTSADGGTDLDFGLYPTSVLASGTVHARVKVSPSSSASVGDVLCRLYYAAGETSPEDKPGTVSNGYAHFFPLEEDPSGSAPQMLDWVSGTNRLTSNGSMTSGDLVTGQVGKGIDFDGTNDSLSNDALKPGQGSTTMTLEFIFKSGADQTGTIIACGYNESWRVYDAFSRDFIHMVDAGSSTIIQNGSALAFDDADWHGCAIRLDGTNAVMRFDGTQVATAAYSATLGSGVFGLSLGCMAGSQNQSPWLGTLDEVRISTGARSNDWLAYAYTDDFANATTFTLSAEQGGGGGGTRGTPFGTRGTAFNGGRVFRGILA